MEARPRGKLHQTAVELLNEPWVKTREVARAIGVSHRWVDYLKSDHYTSPGVNEVELVVDYLKKRKRQIQRSK